MRLLVIFLLTYCLLPLALGWLAQALARWAGLAWFETQRAQRWVLRAVWGLALLGGVVFLVLRLGTPVGYPGVLIGVAPLLMPALLLCGALAGTRRRIHAAPSAAQAPAPTLSMQAGRSGLAADTGSRPRA